MSHKSHGLSDPLILIAFVNLMDQYMKEKCSNDAEAVICGLYRNVWKSIDVNIKMKSSNQSENVFTHDKKLQIKQNIVCLCILGYLYRQVLFQIVIMNFNIHH